MTGRRRSILFALLATAVIAVALWAGLSVVLEPPPPAVFSGP